MPTIAENMIRIAGASTYIPTNFDIRINWLYVADGAGVGLGKPGAKVGELWFETLAPEPLSYTMYGGDLVGSNVTPDLRTDRIRLYWQKTASTYTYLELAGFVHTNFIYLSKYVRITAKEALEDTDESSFIVPLHYDTWKSTALVHSSQMATACVYSLFNCYESKKQKWYESQVFQIILVIVIVIVTTVLTGGTGFGILGTHMAIGTALGLTGLTAAIVGSVANALAALVLTTMIQQVATGLFGPEVGAIVAAVFMFVLGNVSSGMGGIGGTMNMDWGSLLKVDNLLAMTNAIGKAGAAMINGEATQIRTETQQMEKSAKAEAEKIQQAYFQEFGYGGGQIDPMMFVDGADTSRILAESSSTFLTRTLMTGSEIAELSQDLLYNFAEYSTKLPDAYT
jgi:hypothetical protein